MTKYKQEFISMISEMAPHISSKIAESWVDETINVCEENINNSDIFDISGKERLLEVKKQMITHIRRLSTIGGSEIGLFVAHKRGENTPLFMKTASEAVRLKLCLDTPEPYSGNTERGILFESVARRKFLSQMKPKYNLQP